MQKFRKNHSHVESSNKNIIIENYTITKLSHLSISKKKKTQKKFALSYVLTNKSIAREKKYSSII